MSNDWLFEGEPFTEVPKGYEGFVYLIYDKSTNKSYIGKKFFHNIRKVKGKTRRQRTESNWKEYYSSSDVVKNLKEEYGDDRFDRHILVLCKTRGDVNRMETTLLYRYNAVERDDFYNESVGNMKSTSDEIIESRQYNQQFDLLPPEFKLPN